MSDSLFGFDNGFNFDSSMMESLSAVSPILSTFGAVNSAIGSYYQAEAQKNNLQFQSEMAKINAQIGEINAQSVILGGQRAQQNSRLRTAHLKSAQRVGMAANGIDLGSKTATNILTSTDYMGEIDANTIELNAIRAAWGYRTQSTNSMATARMNQAAADSINPFGTATGSLLGNSGSVAESWYKYSQRK